MFDDEKIKLIETLPDKDTILIIWVKLLAQAGKTNASGYIYLNEKMPYTEEMLSTIFNRPLNTVRLALETFVRFGLIEVNDTGIFIENWEKHQNIDGMDKIKEQNRLRKQKQRDKQKLLTTSHVTVTGGHATDKEEDKIKNKDKNSYGEFKNIKLTEEEHIKLKSVYGRHLEDAISKVDTYIESNGKKYKSHYAVFSKGNWVYKDFKDKLEKRKYNGLA